MWRTCHTCQGSPTNLTNLPGSEQDWLANPYRYGPRPEQTRLLQSAAPATAWQVTTGRGTGSGRGNWGRIFACGRTVDPPEVPGRRSQQITSRPRNHLRATPSSSTPDGLGALRLRSSAQSSQGAATSSLASWMAPWQDLRSCMQIKLPFPIVIELGLEQVGASAR